jgi:uncharacterized RDD family membrane protein YckC
MVGGYKRAGFLRRSLARGIDLLILVVTQPLGSWSVLIDLLYFFLALLVFKKTIGDKILNLELISFDNSRPRIRWYQVIIRLILMPLAIFHGVLSLFLGNTQLLHDRIAKTDMIVK